jgi:hypothetical protein
MTNDRTREPSQRMSTVEPMGTGLKAGWLTIMAHFGEVQTLVILGFFYAFLLGPAWIFMSRQDLLAKRKLREPGGAWMKADTAAPDLERSKRLT